MEKIFTQQEVLLMTGSSFSTRQWAERTESARDSGTPEEKLEEACWNGLLKELLPEVFGSENSRSMFLWKVRKSDSFLELELSESPMENDHATSIVPQYFLGTQSLN